MKTKPENSLGLDHIEAEAEAEMVDILSIDRKMEINLDDTHQIDQMEMENNPKRKRGASSLGMVGSSRKRKIGMSECFMKILGLIIPKDNYGFFLQPVDTKLVPDYTRIIKTPMDLGTMKKKVQKGIYKNPNAFKVKFI